MAEGIVLSLAAEKRELVRSSGGGGVSSTSPSPSPLSADAPLSHGIIARLSHLSINRLQRALRAVPDDPKARAALADAYQTLAVAASRQGNVDQAERAYKMFRNLYMAPFAKCSKSGLSYKGRCLVVLLQMLATLMVDNSYLQTIYWGS